MSSWSHSLRTVNWNVDHTISWWNLWKIPWNLCDLIISYEMLIVPFKQLTNNIHLGARKVLLSLEGTKQHGQPTCIRNSRENAPKSKHNKLIYMPRSNTLIFHLPLRLVSRCFLAAPRSDSVRGWPVRPAEFLSDRGRGEFQLLPSLFPVWQRAEALLQQMFTPSHSSSICSAVPSAQVVTVELVVQPTWSWHVRVKDTKNLDL